VKTSPYAMDAPFLVAIILYELYLLSGSTGLLVLVELEQSQNSEKKRYGAIKNKKQKTATKLRRVLKPSAKIS